MSTSDLGVPIPGFRESDGENETVPPSDLTQAARRTVDSAAGSVEPGEERAGTDDGGTGVLDVAPQRAV